MTTSQKALAAFFNFTGTMHFVIPKSYEATVPDYVPISPKAAVFHSGWAEMAGGLAVESPQALSDPWGPSPSGTRRPGG